MQHSKRFLFTALASLLIFAAPLPNSTAQGFHRSSLNNYYFNFSNSRSRAFNWSYYFPASNYTIPQSRQQKTSQPVAESKNLSLSASEVINLVNQARAQNGLNPLSENQKLDSSAKMKADYILSQQDFSHNTPTGSVSYWPDSVNYAYSSFGENLAYGDFSSSNDLVQKWMNSPGHRANILGSQYTEIGVSVIRGNFNGREVWVAVQHFGSPR